MKINILRLAPIAAATALAVTPAVLAAPKHQDTVQDASKVFQEMMAKPETRVPNALLRRSQAIAIIPSVKQAGFIFGGRRGTGVLMTHYANGTWSNPVFINVTGGSFGLQAGAKSTDMILVFPSQKIFEQCADRTLLRARWQCDGDRRQVGRKSSGSPR